MVFGEGVGTGRVVRVTLVEVRSGWTMARIVLGIGVDILGSLIIGFGWEERYSDGEKIIKVNLNPSR